MIEFIQQLGYPIALVLIMMVYISKKDLQNRDDNIHREDRMFEALDKFGDTMDKFNTTLMSLQVELSVVKKSLGVGDNSSTTVNTINDNEVNKVNEQ